MHPPAASGVSHERKLRSYQVEASFYERVAPRLPAAAAVPRCLGIHSTLHSREPSASGGASSGTPDGDSGCGALQLVMVDLRAEFPCRWVQGGPLWHAWLLCKLAAKGHKVNWLSLPIACPPARPSCSCSTLDEAHARAALRWLAAFHAACWGADAAALGLWEQGSYWCLQTRCGFRAACRRRAHHLRTPA